MRHISLHACATCFCLPVCLQRLKGILSRAGLPYQPAAPPSILTKRQGIDLRKLQCQARKAIESVMVRLDRCWGSN